MGMGVENKKKFSHIHHFLRLHEQQRFFFVGYKVSVRNESLCLVAFKSRLLLLTDKTLARELHDNNDNQGI